MTTVWNSTFGNCVENLTELAWLQTLPFPTIQCHQDVSKFWWFDGDTVITNMIVQNVAKQKNLKLFCPSGVGSSYPTILAKVCLPNYCRSSLVISLGSRDPWDFWGKRTHWGKIPRLLHLLNKNIKLRTQKASWISHKTDTFIRIAQGMCYSQNS